MLRKGVETHRGLANLKTEQLYKVSCPCLDDHHVEKEDLGSVGELSEVCAQIVLKCLYVARIGGPDILQSVETEHLVARTFFPVPVSLSSASHCFFLTHARVCLKSQLGSSCLRAFVKSHLHPHAMSLLGVPHTSSSFCSTPQQIWTSPLVTLTGLRIPHCATPRLVGQSVHKETLREQLPAKGGS